MKLDRKGQPAPLVVQRATIAQLKNRTYATFSGNGMRVDLDSYFRSASGKAAVKKIADTVRAKKR